jgi:hypothetical protein
MSEPQPKRRGRPLGSTKPPGQGKDALIRVRVTQAQASAYTALGGAEWLRGQLDRAARRAKP